uniref:Metalloendopeptidase n=1 Tax=Strongyloides papillosus TaxID=174720 RepID=A0A0N5B205_STREA
MILTKCVKNNLYTLSGFLLMEMLSCESIRMKRAIKNNGETKKLPRNLKYFIDKELSISTIETALLKTQKETCFRFMRTSEIVNDGKTIEFYKGSYSIYSIYQNGSYISRKLFISKDDIKSSGGVQSVLASFLEMMNQISRHDRNKYVKLHYENMKEDELITFDPLSKKKYPTHGVGYDFGSLLHFPSNYNSKNKKNTIEAHKPYYNMMMGQRDEFSFNDYKLINRHYCSKICKSKLVCHNSAYQDINNCGVCKCPNGYKGKYCQDIESSDPKCGQTQLQAYKKVHYLKFKGKNTCTYLITAPKNRKVKLNIILVKTMDKKICTPKSGLEVKYRKDKGAAGLNLCGTYKNIELKSKSRTVLIQYNGKRDDNQFLISYKKL